MMSHTGGTTEEGHESCGNATMAAVESAVPSPHPEEDVARPANAWRPTTTPDEAEELRREVERLRGEVGRQRAVITQLQAAAAAAAAPGDATATTPTNQGQGASVETASLSAATTGLELEKVAEPSSKVECLSLIHI